MRTPLPSRVLGSASHLAVQRCVTVLVIDEPASFGPATPATRLGNNVLVTGLAAQNRRAWDVASRKNVEESSDLLQQAGSGQSLLDAERKLLAPMLGSRPVVVHGQSGNGLDDLDLAVGGATFVVGIDFSAVAAGAAAARAAETDDGVVYVVADIVHSPLADSSADLFYTGKGALMWVPDLDAWAREVARLLRPGGHLFVYEQHPCVPLWSRDEDEVRLTEVDYFGGTRVNDTFPASAIRRFSDDPGLEAVEHQWPLAAVVNSVVEAGMTVLHLGEYPDPFWRPAGALAAAWRGRLPNSFSLLALRA
jgi:SAM-dependent methyltransferase